MKLIALVIGIFVAAVFLDMIEPVKTLSVAVRANAQPWRAACLGAIGIGGTLMLAAFATALFRGRPMTEDEARGFMATSAGTTRIHRVVRGKVLGREGQGETSFATIKAAFRSGAWISDSGVRPFTLGMIGLGLITFGAFGLGILGGPPLVQVICAGALLYALVRFTWAFLRA
jgi:hypothetical protein